MAVGIFLSYRRHASSEAAPVYRELAQRFGTRKVFKDVESIVGGSDSALVMQPGSRVRGSMVVLDSFETTINADWLEPLT
jgi:hypothetical protein